MMPMANYNILNQYFASLRYHKAKPFYMYMYIQETPPMSVPSPNEKDGGLRQVIDNQCKTLLDLMNPNLKAFLHILMVAKDPYN